jgi:NAD(P)-dependent dehydrogenase (short-subunit alcohol dehydrogenase family)
MRDRGWGRVVHINGKDGWLGGWTRIPHSTGKGGLRTLTKSLAAGLGQYGITVNDVSPGFIDTIRDPQTHPEVTRERTDEFLPAIPHPAPANARGDSVGVRLPALDPLGRNHRRGHPRQRRPVDARMCGATDIRPAAAIVGVGYTAQGERPSEPIAARARSR